MSFVVSPLSADAFRPLFGAPDAVLAEHGVIRRIVERPGSPCRLTLEDAAPGEAVLLLNYEHQPADTPFKARHAIFIREGATEVAFGPGELPPAFRARSHLSLRAFDAEGMMVEAELSTVAELAGSIARMFEAPEVAYLHAHYAGAGCYAARIDRFHASA